MLQLVWRQEDQRHQGGSFEVTSLGLKEAKDLVESAPVCGQRSGDQGRGRGDQGQVRGGRCSSRAQVMVRAPLARRSAEPWLVAHRARPSDRIDESHGAAMPGFQRHTCALPGDHAPSRTPQSAREAWYAFVHLRAVLRGYPYEPDSLVCTPKATLLVCTRLLSSLIDQACSKPPAVGAVISIRRKERGRAYEAKGTDADPPA